MISVVAEVIVAIAAGALVSVVWLSVLRTVFTPRRRTTMAARGTTHVVATVLLTVARRLPGQARERLLDLCTPAALFVMAVCWLVAAELGFAMLAWAIADVSWRPDSLADFFLLRSAGTPLAALALLSTGLLLATFTTHLVRVTDAYSRRELPVIRLAGEASRPPDAEAVLAHYLRTGSRDHLDNMFAEWASWLADIQGTHVEYPSLTYSRPAGELCWIKAAVIVLDAAALTQAIAPSWSPPHTRTLIAAGTRSMQLVAAQTGVVLHPLPISLHGREENGFAETIDLAVQAGLPREQDECITWATFQDLRIRYAPHAAAVASRLLYHHDASALDGAPPSSEEDSWSATT